MDAWQQRGSAEGGGGWDGYTSSTMNDDECRSPWLSTWSSGTGSAQDCIACLSDLIRLSVARL